MLEEKEPVSSSSKLLVIGAAAGPAHAAVDAMSNGQIRKPCGLAVRAQPSATVAFSSDRLCETQ